MIALKIIAGIGITALCGAVGYKAGRRYTLRDTVLSDFILMCDYMRGDIAFFHKPMKIMIEGYMDKFCPETAEILRTYLSCLDTGTDAAALREKIPAAYLTPDDREYVVQLLSVLGKSDEEAQVESIGAFRLTLADKQKESAANRKKYSSLYPRLGLLAGACAALIIL
jgi:stage III sporulation protein AB